MMKRNDVFAWIGFWALLLTLTYGCTPRPGGGETAGGAEGITESLPADVDSEVAVAREEPQAVLLSDSAGDFSIVLDPETGFVGINGKGERLYQVFLYDNGPDYPSDGYFRIVENEKIGYADEETGTVRIKPQYTAAYPFENGYAPVCPDCVTEKDGEYSRWVNGKWGLIDKQGRVVVEPQFEQILEIGEDGRALVENQNGERWVEIE